MSNPNGWNYRVVHIVGTLPESKERYELYEIHEVYYTENKPTSMTVNAVSPRGETPEEFLQSWNLYKGAFEKRTLVWDDDFDKFIDADEDTPI